MYRCPLMDVEGVADAPTCPPAWATLRKMQLRCLSVSSSRLEHESWRGLSCVITSSHKEQVASSGGTDRCEAWIPPRVWALCVCSHPPSTPFLSFPLRRGRRWGSRPGTSQGRGCHPNTKALLVEPSVMSPAMALPKGIHVTRHVQSPLSNDG